MSLPLAASCQYGQMHLNNEGDYLGPLQSQPHSSASPHSLQNQHLGVGKSERPRMISRGKGCDGRKPKVGESGVGRYIEVRNEHWQGVVRPKRGGVRAEKGGMR